MKRKSTSDLADLRLKAEELLRKKLPKTGPQLSEAELLKLVHEIEVHQIELELQQEEIMWAYEHADSLVGNMAPDEYIELFNFTQTGCFSLSVEGVIIELNLSGAKMLGKELSKLKGSRFGFFVSDDKKSVFNTFLDKIFSTRVKDSCEITLLNKTDLPVYVTITGIISGNGKHCLITVNDLTRIIQYKEALKENTSRLELAMQSSKMAWWEMDITTGSITFGNRKAEMLGYPPEMFKHYTDFTALLHPEDVEKAMNAMRRHLEGLSDKYDVEYRILNQSGEYKWFHDIGAVVKRDFKGKPLYVTGLVINITEHKRAEAEQLKISSRLSLASRAGGIGIWELDIVNNNLVWDEQMFNLYGILPTQFSGSYQAWRNGVHPDDLQRVEDELQSAKSGYKDFDTEFRVVWPDASVHIIRALANVIRDTNGQAISMIGTNYDITKFKQSEEELRFRNIILSTQQESSIDGILVVDNNANIVSYNNRFVSMWGVPAVLVEKKDDIPVLDFISKQVADTPSFLRQVRYLNDHKKETSRDEIVLKNGCIFDRYSAPMIGKDDQYYGRVWYFRDITDHKHIEAQTLQLLAEAVESRQVLLNVIENQKRTEMALRDSETRLHTLVQTIPDLIWLKDINGVYLSCNTMFERFFGAVEADIVGKTDYDFVDKKLADFFREHDQKAMFAEKPTSNEEWITFADDGHRVFLETIKTPMYDSKGTLIGVLGIGRDITERKLAENALHDSFERYKKLTLISPIGIFHTDVNGLTTFVNPTWSKISGLSYENALGNNWLNAVHPDDKEKLFKGWKEANQFHKTSYSDYRFVHPDGSIAWVMGQAIPETNAEGKIIGYIGTITDITERKKSEDAIRESNFFLQILLNAIPVPIFYKNIEGRYTGINRAFELFFGKSSKELEGKSVFDISSYELAEIYHARDMDLLRTKGVHVYDSQIKDSQNVVHDVVFHKAAIVDSNEQVAGLIGVILDITERKNSEKEIAMLAHSLKCVNECVSITDLNNKILFVNESFLKTYGYELDELIGKNINIVRSKKNVTEFVNGILPTTIRGEWQGELLNVRKDGSEFPIFLSSTIIKDKENKILGLIGVGTDISERKLAEQELISAKEHAEESDRLKSSFLANMSHEIRTPMNGILGFAGLLKEPDLSGEEQQEYIQLIEKSGARMLNIINDIVSISKLESGQMEIAMSKTNINEQMNHIYALFYPETIQKGVKLNINNSLPAQETIIYTDKEKFSAIITNLVKNAIKFTSVGLIEFGCGKKGEMLEFYVKDTGLGILKEQENYIFERFRQGSESLNRTYEGAGLGLSISKAYVEMLGGEIWVDSEYGKGSTFHFTIPCDRGMHGEIVNRNIGVADESEIKIGNLKILVADDDETSEILIARYIEKFSSEILTANNGVDAVEVFRRHPDVNFILMDIKMPKMDGLEATRQIREFNKEVVIIAQSAYALAGDREKALEAGCNDYISKPFGKASLKELIRKYLISQNM